MTGTGGIKPVNELSGPTQPSQSTYLICSVSRTGSHLLCEGLTSTGLAGMPDEHFGMLPLGTDAGEYVSRCLRTLSTPNGVFGAKVGKYYYENLVRGLRSSKWGKHAQTLVNPHALNRRPEDLLFAASGFAGRVRRASAVRHAPVPSFVRRWRLQRLHATHPAELALGGSNTLALHETVARHLPNLRYIFLRRNDKVRQAISLYRAQASKEWQAYEHKGTPTDSGEQLVYDGVRIAQLLAAIRNDEALWEMHFSVCGVAPLTVYYEDVVRNRAYVVERILAFLDIAHPTAIELPDPRLKRQSDSITDDWVERFTREESTYDIAS
jgi:LPS sulfotransferase NodH